MANSNGLDVSKFFTKIGPGGKYFKYSLAILIVLGLLLVTLLTMVFLPMITDGKFQNIFSRKFLGQIETQPTPYPVPTVCPNYEIPTGQQKFEFSRGKDATGPKIQTAIYDPLDPDLDQKLTLTITVKNESPVTFATATLITDNKEDTAKFRLTNGSDTDGTWQTTWTIKDSYKCRYAVKFDLRSSTGNYDRVMYIK